MKVSYKLLKKYVAIDDNIADLCTKLTNSGFEVEGIEHVCQATNLVIGQVLDCVDHPDSDHLHVCQVDLKDEQVQIVCGAPNVAKGQKVIVARVGAVLPNITIKQGMIRGQLSNGMICSLSELGIDKKQLREDQLIGIEILAEDAVIGGSPLAYLGLDDIIIDISITPNRADCNSFFAFCREVSAIMKAEISLPVIENITGQNSDLKISSETEKCKLFLGRIIKGVKVSSSPQWIKEILIAHGIKSINNLVDISNLVMLETGQPMHFYDADNLGHAQLKCTADYDGEYEALDGNIYQIQIGDLVIKSGQQVVGIAGIMGGSKTKITEQTVNLVLESANFDLAAIRQTSRRLNLLTDAAIRFSKAISPQQTYQALDRATWLLKEYADAQIIEKVSVHDTYDYQSKKILLSVNDCNRLLNTDFSLSDICDVMQRLQFKYLIEDESLLVTVPDYRLDLNIKEDLIEEVVRILGFDRVKASLPLLSTTLGKHANHQLQRQHIKDTLIGEGFYEALTYSLVSQRHLDHGCLKAGQAVTLANPFSDDRKYYRISLLPSLMDVAVYNTARFQSEFAFYEIANVYDDKDNQAERLALVLSNKKTYSRWQKIDQTQDFYYLKGLIVGIIKQLGFDEKRINFVKNDIDQLNFHPGQSTAIYLDKSLVGVMGIIHPRQQKDYNLGTVAMAEIDLSTLYNSKAGKLKYVPITRYPSITFDIAMLVQSELPAGKIVDTIKRSGKNMISRIEIFDVYQGENVKAGQKSIGVSITFQSQEKTLADKDIQPIIKQITDDLTKQLSAVIREK
jgi:phenylalanyl-tRNA synthetase beta chain